MADQSAECAALAALFPDFVRCACMRVQDAPHDICEEERLFVKKAVEKRRREFSAGRCCARQALTALGCATGPILQGTNGAPLWPSGFVGAITHTSMYAAAAVAPSARLRGIGLDFETVSRVSEAIAGKVLTESEARCLHMSADPLERQRLLALIFSAKESVYKCLHPITRSRISFEDACVEYESARGLMSIRLSVRTRAAVAGPGSLPGRFRYVNNTVCTAVWLAA
jgi:4'-phosphopantetheinyl transferase EntD